MFLTCAFNWNAFCFLGGFFCLFFCRCFIDAADKNRIWKINKLTNPARYTSILNHQAAFVFFMLLLYLGLLISFILPSALPPYFPLPSFLCLGPHSSCSFSLPVFFFDQMPCCHAVSRQWDVSGPSNRHIRASQYSMSETKKRFSTLLPCEFEGEGAPVCFQGDDF